MPCPQAKERDRALHNLPEASTNPATQSKGMDSLRFSLFMGERFGP